MTQTDFEPNLIFVTLVDDGYSLLLNGDQRYSIRLPMDLSRKTVAGKQNAVETEIRNGCNSFGLNTVNSENIRRRAEEAITSLEQRWATAREERLRPKMASSNQIELDISYNLKNKGFRLIKDGQTVLLEDGEGNQARSYIYKEWNKTVKKFEDEIEKMQIVKDKLIFQEILACLTKNYNKIYSDNDNGSTSSIIASDSINDSTLEPETPLDKLNDITPEYWRTQLIAKYDVLQETIKTSITPLPQLKLSLEFALSVKNVLNIHDNTLPFAGFLLGAPSSLKTVTVELFRAYWHAKYTDDFSPKAFVSHYSGLPKEKLAEIDLLQKYVSSSF